jgi:hypothetical protein
LLPFGVFDLESKDLFKWPDVRLQAGRSDNSAQDNSAQNLAATSLEPDVWLFERVFTF